jgi:hypothetical protein
MYILYGHPLFSLKHSYGNTNKAFVLLNNLLLSIFLKSTHFFTPKPQELVAIYLGHMTEQNAVSG